MSNWFDQIKVLKWFSKPWLADALALAGVVVYALRSWYLAHYLTSLSLDEGMYMVKGYFFATGKYLPYQDYGPLTNHMPLSFLIPGYVQAWFGSGLETGRVFAIVLGLAMLVGLWLVAKRLGGAWWAAFIIWIFALTSSWIEIFSQGLSQGIINVFVVWALAALVGEERKTWQVALAATLAGLAVMTRINVLPFLLLLLIYIYWQHGWKKGLIATAAALLVCGSIFVLYWPEILKFLSGWIPEGWLAFVEPYRSPWSQQHVPVGFSYLPLTWLLDQTSEQWNGLKALFETLNLNFVPFLAVLGTLAFWPRPKDWRSTYQFRLALFLLLAWIAMAGMHIWVAISGSSCHFFCMAGYFSFFNVLAVILLVVTLSSWQRKAPVWRQVLAVLFLILVIGGALYTAGYRPQQFSRQWYTFMDTPVPRWKDGQFITTDTGPLRSIFESKLGLSYQFLVEQLPDYLYWILPLLLFFVAVTLLYRWFRGATFRLFSFGWFALALFILLGVVLGPTPIFYGETNNLRCDENVIESHEQVGATLASLIPRGSQLFWELQSNILLLYLPDVEIYPPQLNTGFNYVAGSSPEESDTIYRFSYWDQHLANEWAEQADYILVPGDRLELWQAGIDSGEYVVVKVTAPFETCRGDDARVILLQHGPGE